MDVKPTRANVTFIYQGQYQTIISALKHESDFERDLGSVLAKNTDQNIFQVRILKCYKKTFPLEPGLKLNLYNRFSIEVRYGLPELGYVFAQIKISGRHDQPEIIYNKLKDQGIEEVGVGRSVTEDQQFIVTMSLCGSESQSSVKTKPDIPWPSTISAVRPETNILVVGQQQPSCQLDQIGESEKEDLNIEVLPRRALVAMAVGASGRGKFDLVEKINTILAH